jgi:hypothetical protein
VLNLAAKTQKITGKTSHWKTIFTAKIQQKQASMTQSSYIFAAI